MTADAALAELLEVSDSPTSHWLTDALVFAVREQGHAAVAVADPDATAGLVFYDLRQALRAIVGAA